MTHGRLILAGWLVLLVTIAGAWFANQHTSCLRADSIRAALSIYYRSQVPLALAQSKVDKGVIRVSDLTRYRSSKATLYALRPLQCSDLIPPTR